MILQGVTRRYSTHIYSQNTFDMFSQHKPFKGREASSSEVFICCQAGDHSGLCMTTLLAFSLLLLLLLLKLSCLNTTLVIRSQLCFKSSSFFLQNLSLAPKVLSVLSAMSVQPCSLAPCSFSPLCRAPLVSSLSRNSSPLFSAYTNLP